MKHHFGDFLDREGEYWTIIPNRERYDYAVGNVPIGSKQITIITISRHEPNWKRVFTFPNLEELTLHEPSKDQLNSLADLQSIKRLRITHARPNTLDFIRTFVNVEELVLEYVSGFSDLSPLRDLSRLRSLHVENLRRVSDFSGLDGISSLRYLRIDGTFDWKQPIDDFEFLKGLPNLEVLSIGHVITRASYPALLPALSLKALKKIKIPINIFSTNEYALLEAGLPNVDGATWDVCSVFGAQVDLPKSDIRPHLPLDVLKVNHPDVFIRYDGRRMINDPATEWYEFLGKGAGHIKRTSAMAEKKCSEHKEKYALMKEEAKKYL